MKISKDFILRQVAGNYVVVAVGKKAKEFNAVISLNETGAFIWKLLEKGETEEQIVLSLTLEYDVDKETATIKTREFIQKLKDAKVIE